jgi:hypothetical protein
MISSLQPHLSAHDQAYLDRTSQPPSATRGKFTSYYPTAGASNVHGAGGEGGEVDCKGLRITQTDHGADAQLRRYVAQVNDNGGSTKGIPMPVFVLAGNKKIGYGSIVHMSGEDMRGLFANIDAPKWLVDYFVKHGAYGILRDTGSAFDETGTKRFDLCTTRDLENKTFYLQTELVHRAPVRSKVAPAQILEEAERMVATLYDKNPPIALLPKDIKSATAQRRIEQLTFATLLRRA